MLVEARYPGLFGRFTPTTVFMHIGATDCELAIAAAGYCERVYIVDPLRIPGRGTRLPVNLRMVAATEEGLPIPENTVDIALTEDPSKLRFIRRCLVPGGVLLSPDRALSNALRDAGYSRVRVPWFNPLVEAMR